MGRELAALEVIQVPPVGGGRFQVAPDHVTVPLYSCGSTHSKGPTQRDPIGVVMETIPPPTICGGGT